MYKKSIFWFRRDLRMQDNRGLYHALSQSGSVLPIFIFDTEILDALPEEDARVGFIHASVLQLKLSIQSLGGDLMVYIGAPERVWHEIVTAEQPEAVYFNRDYEPYAQKRDEEVIRWLEKRGIACHSFKDHVIMDDADVVKKDGSPYTVFTPYKRRWLEVLHHQQGQSLTTVDTMKYSDRWEKRTIKGRMPSLEDLGFRHSTIEIPSMYVPQKIIREYGEKRDYPALDATSRLGIHFRFGTISIREKARKAQRLSQTFLSELIWRDFYSNILHHFPHVINNAFRPKYDGIVWRNDEKEFERWKWGQTGYPLVDAGMRQLVQTGYMHNRVRMITASFLTKHLLIDWRWGEAWFALHLLDFDLASNNGGWQWAAGCGTDAAPYFRIFNPESQQKKFDPDYVYVRRWVPEWGTSEYPSPMVDHKEARARCLQTYKAALEA